MESPITISEVLKTLELLAPPALQESYDNTGIQCGDPSALLTSILITLDITPEVVDEAITRGSNLIVGHHPVIFGGIKRITGATATGRVLMKAISHGITLYAAHTNLDNVTGGVNSMIARKLGLENTAILQPLRGKLRKLVTFVPPSHLIQVREALFSAGAGQIGNYDQCSFNTEGYGTFRGDEGTHPFAGVPGTLHQESETRTETIFPAWKETAVVAALLASHPYEEVAYDIYPLDNAHPAIGAGISGTLPMAVTESEFLARLKKVFSIPVIRHSPLLNRKVQKVALCGGAGSFLLKEAIASGADIFLTGDIKYHQFAEPDGRIVMADIGHFESEQFTKQLFLEYLTKKFPTFAVRLSEVNTNPVGYYL